MTFPATSSDTSAQPDSGSGKESGGKGAEDRIRQLVGQRNEAQRQAAQRDQEFAALKDEMKQLRESFGRGAQDELKPASFADLPVDQLKAQLGQALTDNDGPLAAELQFEMQRRLASQTSDRKADELRSEHQQAQFTQGLQQEIQTRFADVMADPASEVMQSADRYARQFQSHLGSDVLDKQPVYALVSFALASLDASKASHAAKVEELQNEIAQLREGQGLQSGLKEATALNNASREALDKGDIQGAFRNLGVFKSLDS